jgi:heparan-alpha-glucosaminide N-acetyltransferase
MPRLLSLDAFRGFVILLMIWVNYVAGMPGIPYWLEHAGPRADGITLPDLVFPGFLFIVGMSIPFALRRQAAPDWRLAWRAASLMLAGVVLANAYRYDAASALLPRAWYFLLFYAAMILLWRQGGQAWPRWLGAALMVFLVVTFRGSLNAEFTSVWLQHTWWGILGMIGWAYLVCCLAWLATGGRAGALATVFCGMIALSLAGSAGALAWLPDAVNSFVNVPQVLGSSAANVLAGTLATLILGAGGAGAAAGTAGAAHAGLAPPVSHLWRLAALAVGLFATGMLLRPWVAINKIQATAPYTLVCSGIVLALFLLFYLLIDVLQYRSWAQWLLPAGANALLAYILPDLWEQAAAVLHMPRIWWPYLSTGGVAGLLNAAVMTVLMMFLVALANRAGLKLKF